MPSKQALHPHQRRVDLPIRPSGFWIRARNCWRKGRRVFWLWAIWLSVSFSLPALAAPNSLDAVPALHPASQAPQTLVLFNRPIAELRSSLGGLDAEERVARAQRRFSDLSPAERAAPVTTASFSHSGEQGLSLLVGERPIFSLMPQDLDPEDHLSLAAAAERAQRRLSMALAAQRAQSDPSVVLKGTGVSLAIAVAAGLFLMLALRLHQRLDAAARLHSGTLETGARAYLRLFWLRLTASGVWLLLASLWFAAALGVLNAFPWTQPWAASMGAFVRDLGGWTLAGITGAIPGLFTIALVLLIARAVQEALAMFLRHVQSGRLHVPFIHPETTGATRRLLNVLVWGTALAVAYPYLPGAESAAFKGVSVLFGLMITLGSTGLVSQLMGGLVVVYSRSLKRGDFVAINGVEGVVSEVGALAVKIINMRNEEITLPNSVITSSAIHNYSKLAGEQGTLVSTQVTIGYDTPWRQVHALLTTAALAAPGVRHQPAPFVYQRGLNDFYVTYELFAHIDRPLERVAILSALHAGIQDEFNRYGVQIMSPNFYEQPAQPVVVPPGQWFAAPARAPDVESPTPKQS